MAKSKTEFCSDFYRYDEKLSEYECQVRDTLREFLRQEKIKEAIRDCNDRGLPLPFQFLRELGTLGFIGANIPDETGNVISNLGYGIINREAEAADSALRSAISVQGGLVMYPIWRFGSDEQKARWLTGLRTYDVVGCFGLTEEYGGSNPADMRTSASEISAEKIEKEYILNGEKQWITHAKSANIAVVWAKLNGLIRGFLVEKESPGFIQTIIKRKGALRASETGTLAFVNCRIPKENILPGTIQPEGRDLIPALSCLNKARYGIAWGAGGIIRTCYQAIWERMQERAPFKTPLAGKQLVQEDLAIIDARLVDAQALCFRLAELADMRDAKKITEKELSDQISFAKWRCIEFAIDAVNRCLELAGADGLVYDNPFWAHFANLRVIQTYEGTKKIHTLIQGKRITGISALEQ
jgi:glutaryl-CoA dehydrogenase